MNRSRARCRRIAFLACTVLVLPVALGAQASLVPVDHPVYEWLHRQRALGHVPGFSYENLPLSRRQITDLLVLVDGRDGLLSSIDRALRRQYAAEFALDTALLRRPITLAQGWDTNFGKTVRQKFRLLFSDREPHAVAYSDAVNNITVDYRWGIGGVSAREGGTPTRDEYQFGGVRGYATLERRLGFHVEMVAPYHAEALRFHPQWSQTPEAVARATSILFAQGYASWDRRPFGLDIGTGTVRFGLGARQAVILRTDSPNFNWIRLRFDTKIVQYTFLHGSLDSPTHDTTVAGFPNLATRVSPQRWIAVRRYQVRPFGPVQIAITEAVTYSNRGLDLAYLNPVYPLKVAELDTGDKDDPIVYLDMVLRPVRGVEIYGTLGIDDLYGPCKWDIFRPTGSRCNTDHTTKLLYQGGAHVALKPGSEVQVEFVRIEPFFYTHFLPLNTFQARGFALANDLGPNADEWWLALKQWVPWRGWVRGSVRVARQGLNVVDSAGLVLQDVGGDLTSTHVGQRILHMAGDVHHWHTWGIDGAVEPWPGVAVRFDYQRRLVTRGNRIPNRHVLRASVQFSFYPLGFLLAPFGL